MARVKGMSIGYYIMPSDYNKTKLLRNAVIKFGSEGFHVLVELDRMILNSVNGYYAPNNEITLFQLQQITGVGRTVIQTILTYAISKGYYNNKLALDNEYKILTNENLINIFLKHAKTRKGLAVVLNRIRKLSEYSGLKVKLPIKKESKEIDKIAIVSNEEKNIFEKKKDTEYIIKNKATKILFDNFLIKKEDIESIDSTISQIKKTHSNINTFFKFKIGKINNDYINGKINDMKLYLLDLYN